MIKIKRALAFVTFFVVFLSIYGGMNYFVYTQLADYFKLTGGIRLLIQLIFWFSASSYVFARFLKKFKYTFIISYLGSIWMGLLSISLFVLIIKEALLYILRDYNNEINTAAIVIIPILTLISIAIVLKGPTLKTIDIKYNKTIKDDISIVHLSDIHLGLLTSMGWVEALVKRVNSLRPDLILITGDMVDDEYDKVKKFAPLFKSFDSKLGTYAVSGNHEVYAGFPGFKKFCDEASIEIIDNKRVELDNVTLIGIDDSSNRRAVAPKVELSELLADSDPSKLRIFLSHQPVKFREAVDKGIDLQLSGHTHRGQIPPLNFIVALVYKYSYGIYKYKNSYIYTTSGTGTWGPPMRLFSTSELVKIRVSQG